MSDETAAEIERHRNRLQLVTALLAEEVRLPEQANPHAQKALAGLAEKLRAERKTLVGKLLSAVLNALNSTSLRVAEALGLDDEQADRYRLDVIGAVRRRCEKLDRIVTDVEFTDMYGDALAEQERMLRWAKQAKGEPA